MRKLIVLVLAVAFLVCAALPAGEAQAFQRQWNWLPTPPWGAYNVLVADTRFYDDVPVGYPYVVPGAAGYEAGLFLFPNDSTMNETAGAYSSLTTPIGYTSPYRVLQARASVSDGGQFRLGVGFSTTGYCTYWPTALAWNTYPSYLVKSYLIPVPSGSAIRKVCFSLSDYPDSLATGTSKVLIDYIRFMNTSGTTFWIENFYGSP